jgi:hypothetical protein
MGVIMPVIIDWAGRNFNADEMDGVSGRDSIADPTGRRTQGRSSTRRGFPSGTGDTSWPWELASDLIARTRFLKSNG